MLQIVFGVAGVLVLGFVLGDVLWTTMGEGGGPLTRRATSVIWKSLLVLDGRRQSRLLKWGGVFVTLWAVGLWIVLLWGGWLLVFMAADVAVVDAASRLPAAFWERVYFVGFTLFTLGVGDFVPQGALWQVLTPVATLSGLFVVTFAITYLVPVVQAATEKRQLGVRIAGLGLSPQEIVLNTWDGRDCSGLDAFLRDLAPGLALLEQRHLTYPVLHYFHSDSPVPAIALRVAALDEALTILACGMPDRCGMHTTGFRVARQAVTQVLDTLDAAFIEPAGEAPPPPALEPLRTRGLPVMPDAQFRERVEGLARRRRLLRAFVENEGWAWEQIAPASDVHDPLTPLGERYR